MSLIEIVFAKTGQHLDNLQEAILRGTIQRETYTKIARIFTVTESRVRQVGSELWQILSEELGEDVSKSNFTLGNGEVASLHIFQTFCTKTPCK